MANILHVVNIDFVIPYFLGDQLLYMTERGHHIFIVCSPSSRLKEFSNKYNFLYKEIKILRRFSVFTDVLSIIKICEYIRENKIDIVNGHTPKAGLLAMCASFIMRVPTRIYFRHGLLHETALGIKKQIFVFCERLASLFSTKVVCVSPYLMERSLEEHLSSALKLHILNQGSCNGVDVYGKFNPLNICNEKLQYLRSKYILSHNAWVIGYTGRLVKDKGIVELVMAFELLCNKYPNIYLLLVGPEEERDALPNEIKKVIHSNEKIISTGLIENDIEYYYALMNMLILPSHREGFGTSILEASSMQIPVVATNFTGCKDAMRDGITGIYIDATVESIVNAIERLYCSKEYATKLGVNGRKFVADNFEQHIIWKDIEKMYDLKK